MSLGIGTMEAESGTSNGGLDGALRWIGDLDHPFYSDERQRFVWYEASAVGFQMLLMVQLIGAGLTLLILGVDALLYVALGVVPTVITAFVVLGYAHRRGAVYEPSSSDLRRSRGLFGFGVALIWGAGVMRVSWELAGEGDEAGWFAWDTILGMITGAAAVFGVGYLVIRNQRRKEELAAKD